MTPRDAKTLQLAEAWALDARSHNGEEQQSRAALVAHLEDPAWVSVPREPTDAMLAAAHEADREYTLRNFGDIQTVQQGPYDHWCAMIAAAEKEQP